MARYSIYRLVRCVFEAVDFAADVFMLFEGKEGRQTRLFAMAATNNARLPLSSAKAAALLTKTVLISRKSGDAGRRQRSMLLRPSVAFLRPIQ